MNGFWGFLEWTSPAEGRSTALLLTCSLPLGQPLTCSPAHLLYCSTLSAAPRPEAPPRLAVAGCFGLVTPIFLEIISFLIKIDKYLPYSRLCPAGRLNRQEFQKFCKKNGNIPLPLWTCINSSAEFTSVVNRRLRAATPK